MKEYLREYAYYIFLGIMLGVCNVKITTWQYWVFIIGIILLVNIRHGEAH